MSFLLTQDNPALSLIFVALIGGYLSGSVPYGLILTRMAGLGDIRKVGSGNIGATNVLRAGGKKLAAITLVLDALKGLIPVLIAKQIHMDYAVVTALGALLGHLFPVWLKFKGGKGVATSIGVMLALSWQVGFAIILIWLAMAFATKYSSVSALTAFLAAPFVTGWATHDMQLVLTAFIISIIVWFRHHENIDRLIHDKETKMSFGSKK